MIAIKTNILFNYAFENLPLSVVFFFSDSILSKQRHSSGPSIKSFSTVCIYIENEIDFVISFQ